MVINANVKEELNRAFTDEYIENVGKMFYGFAESFLARKKLERQVYINENIFQYCLVDILVDLARLRHFHDIEYINLIKLLSYAASWWLKRKPLQLYECCEENYIYINEEFALSLLVQAIGGTDKSKYVLKADKEFMNKNLGQIYYHLKYRNTNPQTLELLLIGLASGIGISVNKE